MKKIYAYWDERDALFDRTLSRAEKQLKKEIERSYNKVKRIVSELYDEVNASAANGTILVSDLYKYNRYYDLMNTLDSELVKVGGKEQDILSPALKKMYLDNAKIISKELAFNVVFQEHEVLNAIESIWCSDGYKWSDRIWNNLTTLKVDIKDGVVDTIVQGKSKADLVKYLQHRYNVEYYKADRIARTEIAHTQVQSTLDSYREAGITKVKILNTHDERCCDVCNDMNGKEFYIEDVRNIPPYHPNCRCTVLAVIE